MYAPQCAFSLEEGEFKTIPAHLFFGIPEQKKESWFYRPVLFIVSSLCDLKTRDDLHHKRNFMG